MRLIGKSDRRVQMREIVKVIYEWKMMIDLLMYEARGWTLLKVCLLHDIFVFNPFKFSFQFVVVVNPITEYGKYLPKNQPCSNLTCPALLPLVLDLLSQNLICNHSNCILSYLNYHSLPFSYRASQEFCTCLCVMVIYRGCSICCVMTI